MSKEKYVTPYNAADRLQISLSTLYRRIKNRELRALKCGKLYLIKESDFQEYKDSLTLN